MKALLPIRKTKRTYRNFVYPNMNNLNKITLQNNTLFNDRLYNNNLKVKNENLFVRMLKLMDVNGNDSLEETYLMLLTKANTICSHFNISCMYNQGQMYTGVLTNNYEYFISKEYSKYPTELPKFYQDYNNIIITPCVVPLFTDDVNISYDFHYQKQKVEDKTISLYQIDIVLLGLGYWCYVNNYLNDIPISSSIQNYVQNYVLKNYIYYKNIFNLYNVNYFQLLTNLDSEFIINMIKPSFNIIPIENYYTDYLNRLHNFQLKQKMGDPYEIKTTETVLFNNRPFYRYNWSYNIFYKLQQTNWLLNLPLIRQYSKSMIININNRNNIGSITSPVSEWLISYDKGVLNRQPKIIQDLYTKEVINLKTLLEVNTNTKVRSRI